MKLWTKCREFLRLEQISPWILTFLGLVLAGVLSIVSICLSIRALRQQIPSRPDTTFAAEVPGAVLFGSGVYCTFDGRNWQPAHEIEEGKYVCFPRADRDGGVQQ